MSQCGAARSDHRSPAPAPREGNRILLIASVALLAMWLVFLICVALRLV